jgi:hypothetical protein
MLGRQERLRTCMKIEITKKRIKTEKEIHKSGSSTVNGTRFTANGMPTTVTLSNAPSPKTLEKKLSPYC